MTRNPARRRLLLWLMAVPLLVAGSSAAAVWWLTPLHTVGRRTETFVADSADPRVRCEPGAEALATVIARELPAAITAVENYQGRAFVRPVIVHVCATTESFTAFGGTPGAAGIVFNGRLFIAPKLATMPDRLARVLTHELSHLHLGEQLGFVARARLVPSWFKEGLAVLASNGGGAENTTVAEARTALRSGRSFTPEWTGHLWAERSGKSYGLSEHLWYRESSLLVQFLHDRDSAAFQRLLRAIDAGTPFRRGIEQSYSNSPDALLAEFRLSLER